MTVPRVADYFVVVGLKRLVPFSAVAHRNGEVDVFDVTFKSSIVDRYPFTDHEDTPLPDAVPLFCQPEGVALTRVPSLPTQFSFVLTECSGSRVYGAALTFWEPIARDAVDAFVAAYSAEPLAAASLEGAGSPPSKPPSSGPNLAFLASERSPARRFSDDNLISFDDEAEALRGSAAAVAAGKARPLGPRVRYVPEEVAGPAKDRIYAPKTLCVLSHWPFLLPLQSWLRQLYQLSLSGSPLPLERYISNFMREVPLPPPGRIQVAVYIGERSLILSRPPPNELPLAEFSMRRVFECLSQENVLNVFACLLTERKVLLRTSHRAILTEVAEAFQSFLYPLQWRHVYIPVLPVGLLDFLYAPVPYLMGVHSSLLDDELVSAQLPHEVVIVDLDANTVTSRDESGYMLHPSLLPSLPPRRAAKLSEALRPHHPPFDAAIRDSMFAYVDLAFQNAPAPDDAVGALGSRPFNQKGVRSAFLRFFVSLLKNYRQYIHPPTPAPPPPPGELPHVPSTDELFDKAGFLASLPDECRHFVSSMLETEAFARFVHDRGVHGSEAPPLDVPLFDEHIESKLNDSRFRIFKKETPLLSADGSFTKMYVAMAPDASAVDPVARFAYKVWPALDPKLVPLPRRVEPLVRPEGGRSAATAGDDVYPSGPSGGPGDERPPPPRALVITTFGTWFTLTSWLAGTRWLGPSEAQLETALDVLARMRKGGLRPDEGSYRALLAACGRCGLAEPALKVAADMRSAGSPLDATASVLLARALAADQRERRNAPPNRSSLSPRGPAPAKQPPSPQPPRGGTPTPPGPLDPAAVPVLVRRAGGSQHRRTGSSSESAPPEAPPPALAVRIEVDASALCAHCDVRVPEIDVRAGWSGQLSDYTTRCPKCRGRFVPRFSVMTYPPPPALASGQPLPPLDAYFVPAAAAAAAARAAAVAIFRPLHSPPPDPSRPCPPTVCEFLSPFVLRKEVERLIAEDDAPPAGASGDGHDARGGSLLEGAVPRESAASPIRLVHEHPAIYWNVVWAFADIGLPSEFLLRLPP